MLRPQSGSERELTDPLTSLRCLAPVLRCCFCGDQTRPSVGAGLAQRGCFLFLPGCSRSFAGQCMQIFSLVFSFVSLTRLVTCATLFVYLKAHRSASEAAVSLSRNGMESSLACENRRSRRVSRALANCLRRWKRSCGQSSCEVPEALKAQSQFVVQKY